MFRKKQIIELLSIMVAVVLSVTMSACAPRSVREAESVVTQADSLWQAGKMYGVDAGDSVSLAQAYETLQEHSAFSRQFSEVCPFVHCTSLLRTYSHACYHYGKLLRAKDNSVAAMQVFIAATHSHTRDYHILGRVYSNMGDICHLAGECPLSYDMFERSADMFLRNGDTLNYYYALNDMAFELAEQGKKEETLTLLSDIESQCTDNDVLAKVWETKAELFLLCTQQYDSAIYYIDKMYRTRVYDSNGLLIKAQAYSLLAKKDSSSYYAKQVLNSSKLLGELNNALYILTNDDETKEKTQIRQTAANRSDIQKLLEIRQGKLSQAVQLLKQELNKKPNWSWLYAIIATIVVISIGIGVYVYRKQRNRELLSQKVEELKQSASAIQQKQDQLQTSYQTNRRRMEEDIKRQCVLSRENENLTKDLAWNDFEVMTKIADKHFYKLVSKLRNLHVLNETEIRLCLLVLLDMNRAEISDTLPYSLSGVGKLKDHAAKSLGTTGKNLRQYLINLAIEG